MQTKQNWPKIGLIGLGLAVAALFFGLGLVCGRFVLSPPAAPVPEVVFFTATPGPATADQAAALPSPTPCGPPPAGWTLYTIQPDDTLSGLADRFQVSQGRILKANCLAPSDMLLAGESLYLPPLPTPIPPTPCLISPPPGWEPYLVQSGDIIFRLAAERGTTTAEVMRVNCLASDVIDINQTLYLPALSLTPTAWPPTATPTAPLIAQLPAVQPTSGLLLPESASSSGAPSSPAPPPSPGGSPSGGAQSFPPGGQPIPEAQISMFNSQGDHPGLVLWSGLPNAPSSKLPCEGAPKGNPWIDAPWMDNPTQLERGERAYFFACEFPAPPSTTFDVKSVGLYTLTAQITWPNKSSYPFELQFYPPPDEKKRVGLAQGFVVFNAICDADLLPTGAYTLTMKDGQGNQTFPFSFTLTDTQKTRLLTVPQAAPAGDAFQVYLCGYHDFQDQKIDISLFYEAARFYTVVPVTDTARIWAGPIYTATTFINDEGWGQTALWSSPNDRGVAYYLYDEKGGIDDTIWLLR